MANGMCSAIKPMGCTHKARDSTRGEKAGQVHSSEGRGVDCARHERKGRCAGSHAEAALRANYQVGLVPRSFLGDEQRGKTLASCVPQVYADWWCAWTLTYSISTHRDIFIVLTKGFRQQGPQVAAYSQVGTSHHSEACIQTALMAASRATCYCSYACLCR